MNPDIAEIKKEIMEARKEVLINKDLLKGLEKLMLLSDIPEIHEVENDLFSTSLGFIYLEKGEYSKAVDVYEKSNESYQAGFCYLLQGDEPKARELWFNAPESEAIQWGKCLIDMIKIKIGQIPTFLQVRNHLECDIGYFIRANRLNYAENLIKCSEVLASINPEAYKFIGRALIYNDYPNLAIEYLLKSQKSIPNDPEIYYHLGQYSFLMEAYKEARMMLNQCLHLNINYTPARTLLEKVIKKMQ